MGAGMGSLWPPMPRTRVEAPVVAVCSGRVELAGSTAALLGMAERRADTALVVVVDRGLPVR